MMRVENPFLIAVLPLAYQIAGFTESGISKINRSNYPLHGSRHLKMEETGYHIERVWSGSTRYGQFFSKFLERSLDCLVGLKVVPLVQNTVRHYISNQ